MKVIVSTKQLRPGDILWHVDYDWRQYKVIKQCDKITGMLHESPCVLIEKTDDGSKGHFGPYFYRDGEWRYRSGKPVCMFPQEDI